MRSPRFSKRSIWLLAGVVVAALVGVGTAVVARREAPSADLQAAERVLFDDPYGARTYLDRYLTRRPDDGRALLLAARAARRDDDYAAAERLLTAAETATGSTSETRLEWRLLGMQQGDFEEEEQLRGWVAMHHPDSLAILEAFPKGFAAAGRWMEAVESYDMLLSRYRDHVPGLIGRAAMLAQVGGLDRESVDAEAERDLRRALRLAPSSAAAHAGLAAHLRRAGQTREAIAHFERALELRPNHQPTLLGLSRAQADAADIPAAERRLDELLALAPDHVEALIERGRLALRRGRPDEAEPLLAKALRAAPWHREACALGLIALNELKRPAEEAGCAARLAKLRAEDAALGRLKSRAANAPSDTAVRWELWQWSARNGETEKGIAWLAEILHLEPDHAQARAAFADYFDRARQPRRAARYRQR